MEARLEPGGHVLMLGRADPILRWMWELSGSTTTSLMVRKSDLAGHVGAAEHRIVIGLGDDASVEDWTAIAESVHRMSPISRVVAFSDAVLPHAVAISAAVGASG